MTLLLLQAEPNHHHQRTRSSPIIDELSLVHHGRISPRYETPPGTPPPPYVDNNQKQNSSSVRVSIECTNIDQVYCKIHNVILLTHCNSSTTKYVWFLGKILECILLYMELLCNTLRVCNRAELKIVSLFLPKKVGLRSSYSFFADYSNKLLLRTI